MEQFSLEKYFENPSRKVVTRQGKSVRIICTDRRHTDSWPIVALEDYGDGEFVIYANIDGRTDMCSENIHDLFFADEEEKLQSIEELLSIIALQEIEYWRTHDKIIRQDFSERAKQILDLARKEILKDLPKWKRVPKTWKVEDNAKVVFSEDYKYYIDKKELFKKLQKE